MTHRPFLILFIDDDQALPLVVTQAARSTFPEAQFTFVSNAHQAQEWLLSGPKRLPQLVLMDVDLNDTIDGLQLLAQIRLDERLSLLQILMISANDQLPLVYQAYQTGASSFIHKPFSLDEWKQFMAGLRQYWYETVTLPPLNGLRSASKE